MLSAFGATVAYWLMVLQRTQPETLPTPPAATQSYAEAADLFGGRLHPQPDQTVRLSGVLVLREGAAAILSVGGTSARAVSQGAIVAPGIKLASVRESSVVIEHNGIRSEIELSPMSAPPIDRQGSLSVAYLR
jgi:general secretion pathway protein C